MNQSLHTNPLATEPVGQLLSKFAVPSIIAMLVSSLYNMVDQLFIGNKIGSLGNAATNIQFPLSILNVSIALLCGIGTAAAFNLAMGRGEKDEAGYYIGNAVTTMVLVGLVLTILTEAFLQPLLIFIGSPDNVLPYAIEYTRITALGFPFFILSAGGGHLVRADGSPNMTMVLNLVGAIINTILDYIFIFIFDWGMAGAAWATIIGQFVSAMIVVVYLTRFKSVKLQLKHFMPKMKHILTFTSLGLAPFFNQIAMMVTQIVLNRTLKYYGGLSVYGEATPIACAGIISKVTGICFSFIIGISQGLQPIASFNYGAKYYQRVRDAYNLAIKIAAAIAIASWVAFQLFPRQLVAMFGDGDDLYFQFSINYFRIYLFGMFLCFLQPLSSNFFTSIGKPKKGIFMSLTRQVIFLIPLILILPIFMGIDGVMYAGPIADTLAFIVCYVLVKHEYKQKEWQETQKKK